MQEYRLHNIGYIMQEDTLLYDRTVEENILLGARFLRHNRKAVHEEMEGLANQLGIAPYLSKRPSKLSGGEKQRVAIARAILGNKPVLLADEPTGALDHDNALAVMECLRQLSAQGKLIILVTHDESVASLCDRTIHLDYGKIVDN